MLVSRVDIRLLALPLVEPFVASHGSFEQRQLVVIKISSDQGCGWGEVAALPQPTYSGEFASGAYDVACQQLAPRLVKGEVTSGLIRSVDCPTMAQRLGDDGTNPMTVAGFEMAVLDAELKSTGRSLADCLGATTDRVGAGAAVGLGPISQVLDRVDALAANGFGRVKVKIKPGIAPELVEGLAARTTQTRIQLDANGSCSAADLDWLIDLAGLGFDAIEQPFPTQELSLAARLVGASPIPIVADEAACNVETVDKLHRAGALSGVSIKAPRLGGLGPALAVHRFCTDHGIPMAAGGMIESGLGRAALVALAALPGFTIDGDISPANRWLQADPWPDVVMTQGHIDVPKTPGVAPPPDPDLLDHFTVRHQVISA